VEAAGSRWSVKNVDVHLKFLWGMADLGAIRTAELREVYLEGM
jgi:hypothetical protein